MMPMALRWGTEAAGKSTGFRVEGQYDPERASCRGLLLRPHDTTVVSILFPLSQYNPQHNPNFTPMGTVHHQRSNYVDGPLSFCYTKIGRVSWVPEILARTVIWRLLGSLSSEPAMVAIP